MSFLPPFSHPQKFCEEESGENLLCHGYLLYEMALSIFDLSPWILAEQKTCQQSEELPSNPWNGDTKGGREEVRLRSGNTATLLKLLASPAGWCGVSTGFDSD